MRFNHTFDNLQIANLLGIYEKIVRNQLSLALRRIRAYLVKEGYHFLVFAGMQASSHISYNDILIIRNINF